MPTKKRVVQTKSASVNTASEEPTTYSQPMRPAVPSNLLTLLLILISFFAGYLFFKVKSLEQQAKQPAAAQQQNAGADAANLDIPNLKKYAKDLGMDTNKFNECLDKHQKKDLVASETKLGADNGVNGTPGFFINGRFLGGAFPFEFFKEVIDKELAGKGSAACADYSDDLKKYCDETGKNAFNPVPKVIDPGTSPVRGSQNARVTIVEFSDFQCPFCIRAFPTVKQVMDTYPNDVRLVYKHFPLSNIHPKAEQSAEAAACAQDQNKFWEFHDKLFTSGAQ